MEIQDRNNLLQQLFMARAENTSVVEFSEQDFADMLKPQKTESILSGDEETKSPVEFKREDYVKADNNFQDKQDVLTKKDKTEAQKDNTTEKTSETDDKVSNKQDKIKDNKTSEASSQQKNEQASSSQQSDKDENTTENIAASETNSQGQDQSLDNADTVSQDNTLTQAQAVMASAQALLNIVPAEEVVLPSDGEVLVDDVVEDIQSVDSVVQSVSEDMMLSEESKDALLLEQARYIDKKVASSDKMKIEVNVSEDKVEAAVAKDVLQNRFEIDQLLQEVDSTDSIIQDDLKPEITLSKENSVRTNQMAADIPVDALPYKRVSVAEVQLSKDVASRPLTEASNLAVSGKEVVFETHSNLRAETFSRLNESSQRDTFKGMGKEVVEQIKINITKSAIKGVDTIDIQLKPEDLGKIQIKMHIAKDGKLHADIISSRPETMDMLQKDVSSLQKAFNDAGYDTDSRSFNFSFQKENQARDGQNDASDLMQFIGDALEQEAKDAAGNDNLEYDPILGLNIKV